MFLSGTELGILISAYHFDVTNNPLRVFQHSNIKAYIVIWSIFLHKLDSTGEK